jgi:transcriptional regulator with XRE-family HTH domain
VVIKARRSKNIVGARVAESRAKQQPPLTQDALSGQLALIGIQLDRAAIAKIETNHRYVLDFELKGIAEVLGVPVDWLLGIGR